MPAPKSRPHFRRDKVRGSRMAVSAGTTMIGRGPAHEPDLLLVDKVLIRNAAGGDLIGQGIQVTRNMHFGAGDILVAHIPEVNFPIHCSQLPQEHHQAGEQQGNKGLQGESFQQVDKLVHDQRNEQCHKRDDADHAHPGRGLIVRMLPVDRMNKKEVSANRNCGFFQLYRLIPKPRRIKGRHKGIEHGMRVGKLGAVVVIITELQYRKFDLFPDDHPALNQLHRCVSGARCYAGIEDQHLRPSAACKQTSPSQSRPGWVPAPPVFPPASSPARRVIGYPFTSEQPEANQPDNNQWDNRPA